MTQPRRPLNERNALAAGHVRLVWKEARRLQARWEVAARRDTGELVSEGMLLLIEAADKWDEHRTGKPFAHFATAFVRMRLPRSVRSLNLIHVPKNGVTSDRLTDAHNAAMSVAMETDFADDDGNPWEPSAPAADPSAQDAAELVAFALGRAVLDPTEAEALRMYFWGGMTHEQIGAHFGGGRGLGEGKIRRALADLREFMETRGLCS
jgi:RNA polymerase sigma factor (sigma-70 family)